MRKLRVLVVDDSIIMRHVLTTLLGSDPDIEVVGAASNGRQALSRLSQMNPDVVTLDLEMPEMNGMETLQHMRKARPRLPIIIVSACDPRHAAVALDALTQGANDYVIKPVPGEREFEQSFRAELILKVKSFETELLEETKRPLPVIRKAAGGTERVDILAIGVSTGGPNALLEVLPRIPANFAIPVLVVQHMPPLFTKLLAERLSSRCALPVQEALAGKRLEPGCIWLAPGDYHMVVKREGESVVLATHQEPPVNACRPAVDVLFKSVAHVYGAHTLAVVLTGMGCDGLRGCERIRAAGGQIVVQDQATSVVWGMPGCVARAGLAHQVLPLHQLPEEILRRVRLGRTA